MGTFAEFRIERRPVVLRPHRTDDVVPAGNGCGRQGATEAGRNARDEDAKWMRGRLIGHGLTIKALPHNVQYLASRPAIC